MSTSEKPAVTDDVKSEKTRQYEDMAAREKARRSAAEDRLARAKVTIPTLPDELPETSVEVSDAGPGLGPVHVYRAAQHAVHHVAGRVSEALGNNKAVLLAGPDTPELAQTRLLVTMAIAEAERLTDTALEDVTEADEEDLTEADEEDVTEAGEGEDETRPKVLVAGGLELIALAGGLLPLVTKMFSTKTTLQSGTVDIDSAAVSDMAALCLAERQVAVRRLDQPEAPRGELLGRWEAAQKRLVATVRSDAAALGSNAAATKAVLDAAVGVAEKFAADAVTLENYLKVVERVARTWADAHAKLEDHNERRSLLDRAQELLDAVAMVGANGWSPLALASVDSSIPRLTVSAVSAGWESTYRDRTIGHDKGIQHGAVVIRFSLDDEHGTTLRSGVHAARSAATVNLKDATVEWGNSEDVPGLSLSTKAASGRATSTSAR